MNKFGKLCCWVIVVSCATSVAAGQERCDGLFDVQARRAALQGADLATIRQACLAIPADPEWREIKIIDELVPTDGYGSDRSGNDFVWAVMVLAGRSLASDDQATEMLKSILLRWARADAFGKTSETHDTYYALKRIMLPVAVAYSILRPSLTAEEDRSLASWIDPLIRRADKLFDGDVDFNNHRDLADSVLMVWGAISGDDRLYQKGIDRYAQVLSSARIDGSLPLETRRGSRALWYMRQTLTSMVVMAEVAKGRSTDLYTLADRDVSVWTLFSFLFGGIDNPVLVDAYAAQNYIPGPQPDYRKQDLGFLDRRSNGRHYLANLEAIARPQPGDFDSRRIASAFLEYAADERPLIDEYVGGNATCFWGTKWN